MRYTLKGHKHDDGGELSFKLSAFLGFVTLKASLDGSLAPEAGIYLCGLRVVDLMSEKEAPESKGPSQETAVRPGVGDKIGQILSMLGDPACSEDLSRIKRWVRGLLRRLAPKKGLLSARVGLSDPADTARLCEIYILLMPVLGKRVRLIPDFDRETVDIDCDIRGRAWIVPTAYLGIRILITGVRIWKTSKRSRSRRTAWASA